MAKAPPTVDAYLADLVHAHKDAVLALRAIALAADPAITERVKWNAPSFCHAGDDRVTMRLHPKDVLQLVFHRGARAKDAAGFAFEDPTGLMTWAAPDRALVTLKDLADVEAKREALTRLVASWVRATT